MSTNNGGTEMGGAQRQRGWWRRNWLWFIPTLLVAVVLIGGGAAYWALYLRIFQLDVYQSAMTTIRSDKQLRQELGEPIKMVKWPPPSARIEEGEKEVRWNVEGPKGHASAHVLAKLMNGIWEITKLDVNGEPVSLAEGADANKAPPYEAPKSVSSKPESNTPAPPNEPAPQINLPIPPGAGPEK